MFWLEERHTLILRPAFSICFSLLLPAPPSPPPFNVTFHTILNLLPLLLVLCYSGYICTSCLLWSMSFHGLQSTAQHRAACLPPIPHASSVHRAGSILPPSAHGSPLHRQALSTTGPILSSLALLSPEKSIAHNPGHITFERVSGPNAGSWQTETKIKGRRI